MTLADQLRQEGKEEGLSEGRLRTLRAAVLRALEIRHGSCPEGMREAIESIDIPALLEALLENAIRSQSLEDFARSL